MGSYGLQLGWSDHLRQLAGRLPRSVETVCVIWDLQNASSPRGQIDDQDYYELLRIQKDARDAVIEFLGAHKDKHGFPLHRLVYAVTSDAIPPPKLKSQKELHSNVNETLNSGATKAQDVDVDASDDYLVTEYVIWKDHRYGESTRPEDNPWDLSGYVLQDLALTRDFDE